MKKLFHVTKTIELEREFFVYAEDEKEAHRVASDHLDDDCFPIHRSDVTDGRDIHSCARALDPFKFDARFTGDEVCNNDDIDDDDFIECITATDFLNKMREKILAEKRDAEMLKKQEKLPGM